MTGKGTKWREYFLSLHNVFCLDLDSSYRYDHFVKFLLPVYSIHTFVCVLSFQHEGNKKEGIHASCMSFLKEILSKITVFIQIEDNSDCIKKSFCMGVSIYIIYLIKLRIIFFDFQKLSLLHHLFLFCLFERGASRIFFHFSKLFLPYFPNCYNFWIYS